MRVTEDFSSFITTDWTRAVAVVLETEVRFIDVLWTGSGSTFIDFTVEDPNLQELDDEDSNIRKLSGNEKMLLLYQWWVTDDMRLDDFPYDIIDFEVYSRKATSDDTDPTQVVTLFAPDSPTPEMIIPTRMVQNNNGQQETVSGFYFADTTLEISVTVGAASPAQAFASIFALLACVLVLL